MLLDLMRKHSRSFIIYIFFGIIIAVFVVNFGPQSAGCAATTSHAARVEGKAISQTLFNYTMSAAGVRSQQVPELQMIQLRAIVMDQLLVRELLAEDALDMGFRISDKEIDDMIVKGRFLVLGQPHPLVRNDEGKFDYDLLSRYVRYSWGINVLKFKEEQRRELLADKLRQFLRTSVKVSEEEVLTDFQSKNTQVDLHYVRFSPSDFRAKVQLDEDRIKGFMTKNKKQIEDYYKDNKAAFQKLPKQVKLQILSVKFADAAGKPAAKQKAESLRKRVLSGESFGRVAAADSEDAESKGAGGMIGWRNEDSPAIDPAATREIPKLQKDQVSGLIEGKDAILLVKVLGRRQGDLALAQAQEEIAEDLFRNEESIRLAKLEAESFIKRAKAGGKLEDLFTSDAVKTDKAEEEKGNEATADEQKEKPPRSPLKIAATSFFSRSGRHLVPGIGIAPDLSADAFKLKKTEVGSRPYVVGQMVYLVACKDRKDPDMAEYNRKKDELSEELMVQKWSRLVRDYAHGRCEEASKSKSISVNNRALVTPGYVPDKKEGPLPSFAPCSSLTEKPGA